MWIESVTCLQALSALFLFLPNLTQKGNHPMIPDTVHTHPCETILIKLLKECQKNQKTLSLFSRRIPCIQTAKWNAIKKAYQKEFQNAVSEEKQKTIYEDICKNVKKAAFPFIHEALIPLSAIQTAVFAHIDCFYDYKNMLQPDTCLHNSQSTCCYPVAQCPECPFHPNNDTPITTTCSIE